MHCPAPRQTLDVGAIREATLREADALASGGVDGLLLANFGDAPFYPKRVPPHTIAFMAVIGREIVQRVPLPLGVNVLRNDALSALAVATAIDAAFIRVNVYTGARLTDQGVVEGEARSTRGSTPARHGATRTNQGFLQQRPLLSVPVVRR